MARVWMDSWQMECCGQPFAVGDAVDWNLSTQVDDEWLRGALGDELAGSITLSEDHHDERREVPSTRATVLVIRCAFGQYAPHAELAKTLYPVPGTTVLIKVAEADGTESRLSPLVFNGYVIDVQVPA